MSLRQKTGQNHNKSFETVAKCKDIGKIAANQNYIDKEVKGRFTSEPLVFRLLTNNPNLKLYKTIILRLVLTGRGNLPPQIKDVENRLKR